MGTQNSEHVNDLTPATHLMRVTADWPEFGIRAGDELLVATRRQPRPGNLMVCMDGSVRRYADGEGPAVVVTSLHRVLDEPTPEKASWCDAILVAAGLKPQPAAAAVA